MTKERRQPARGRRRPAMVVLAMLVPVVAIVAPVTASPSDAGSARQVDPERAAALATAADRALDRDRLLERLVELELPLGLEALLDLESAAGVIDAAASARGRLALAELRARTAPDVASRRGRTLALVEARQALLDASVTDGPRPGWWSELAADQAADLFVHVLAADGADPGLLHGLPGAAPAGRARALDALARTLRTVGAAQAAIGEEIARLARDADGDRSRLRRLRDDADGRIRIVAAATAVLVHRVGAEDPAAQAALDAGGNPARMDLDGAIRELEDAARTVPAPWGDVARLWWGRGLVTTDPAEAERVLGAMAADPARADGLRLAAGLSAADAIRRRRGLAAGLDALGTLAVAAPGAGTRLALADAAVRQTRDHLRSGGRLDAASAVTVLQSYLQVRTLDPRTLRERLGRLHPAWPTEPDRRLPAEVLAAAGIALVDTRPGAAGAWLDAALERHADDPRTLGGAGFVALERAALHDRDGRVEDAIAVLERVLSATVDADRDPSLVAAIDGALRRAAGRGAPMLVAVGLRLLPGRSDDAVLDPWRGACARAALAAGTEAGAEQALALLAAIDRTAGPPPETELLRVAAWRTIAIRSALDEVSAAQWRRVRERAATLDVELAAAGRTDDRGRLRAWEVEALLDLGRPAAAIERLDALDGEVSGLPAVVRAELVRVRLLALADLAGGADRGALERTLSAWLETAPVADGDAAAVAERLLAGMVAAIGEDADDAAATGLAATASAIDDWLSAAGSEAAFLPVGLALRLGEAWRALSAPQRALPWYERLAERFPDAAEVLDGRAECLFARGGDEDLAEAMQLYRRLSAAEPAAADPVAAERWWRARLRQLEILDRVGRADGRVSAQVERLRRRDPALGGRHLKPGFERLARAYGGR